MYLYSETRQSTSKHTASKSPVPLAVCNITDQRITSKSELYKLQDTRNYYFFYLKRWRKLNVFFFRLVYTIKLTIYSNCIL